MVAADPRPHSQPKRRSKLPSRAEGMPVSLNNSLPQRCSLLTPPMPRVVVVSPIANATTISRQRTQIGPVPIFNRPAPYGSHQGICKSTVTQPVVPPNALSTLVFNENRLNKGPVDLSQSPLWITTIA